MSKTTNDTQLTRPSSACKSGPRFLLATALAAGLAAAVAPGVARAQLTWTKAPSNTAAGGGAFGLWLLTDGTVLSHGNGLQNWVILTPDKKGSYTTGTWKSVAASTYARSGATQHILKDGRFFQAGGEYINGPACTPALCVTTEAYDPVANTWTALAPAPYDIGDTGSATLASGKLIYSTRAGSEIQIYDPVANSWTKSPNSFPLGSGDENAWATLQNGGILAVGYATAGAAIYNPATDTWKKTTVPSGFDTGDTGGITQMFDGRVFVYGLNYLSYIYTPGATPDDLGSWVVGPKLQDVEAEDEYSDILPNGQVMGGLVHVMFGAGTVLQLFDPTTNTTSTTPPPAGNVANIPIDYVNLPNGQVMITGSGADYILTLSTGPQDAWRPTVSSVVFNSATNNYTLTGTQISGLVNGADEGDDMTMAENYPIVWLTDSAGDVYYARSTNFSQMTPSVGSNPETCDFTLPTTVPQGSYNLFVSAVGVQSKTGFPFTVGQSSTDTGTGGTGGGTGGTTGTGGKTTGRGRHQRRGWRGRPQRHGWRTTGTTTGTAGTTGTATGTAGTTGTTTGTAGTTGTTTGSAGTGGIVTGSGGTIGGGTAGSTGSGTAGTTGTTTGTAGHGAGGSTSGGGSSGATDSGSSGCSCEVANVSGGRAAGMLTLLGLAFVASRRRRWAPPR